jgi:hypothetical protein
VTTADQDGKRTPVPFFISEGFIRAWIKRDPAWDWRSMTFSDFEDVFEKGVAMSQISDDDPDLRAFRDSGGKLIISHGHADIVIPAQGSIQYYRNVVQKIGSLERTRDFARLFISDGDGHGAPPDPGRGVSIANGLAALMNWVERGEAPDSITGTAYNFVTHELLGCRPIYAYPYVTRYRGSGDPKQVDSYESVIPRALMTDA